MGMHSSFIGVGYSSKGETSSISPKGTYAYIIRLVERNEERKEIKVEDQQIKSAYSTLHKGKGCKCIV